MTEASNCNPHSFRVEIPVDDKSACENQEIMVHGLDIIGVIVENKENRLMLVHLGEELLNLGFESIFVDVLTLAKIIVLYDNDECLVRKMTEKYTHISPLVDVCVCETSPLCNNQMAFLLDSSPILPSHQTPPKLCE